MNSKKRTLPTSWHATESTVDSMDIDDTDLYDTEETEDTDEKILSEDSPSESSFSDDSDSDSDSYFDAFDENESSTSDDEDDDDEKLDIIRKIVQSSEKSENTFLDRFSRLHIKKRSSENVSSNDDEESIQSSFKKLRLR